MWWVHVRSGGAVVFFGDVVSRWVGVDVPVRGVAGVGLKSTLGRKPWLVYPERMTMTPVGAIILLGGVFVEPTLWPHHGRMSLGENLDP
jgi:hypothetical protein